MNKMNKVHEKCEDCVKRKYVIENGYYIIIYNKYFIIDT